MIAGINKDLDKYLSGRRAKSEKRFFSRPPIKIVKEEEQPVPEDMKSDEVHVFDKEQGFWDRLLGGKKEVVEEDLSQEEMERLEAMEVEIEKVERVEEEHPEMMAELEEVREGLLDKFFNLFRGYERRHKMADRAAQLEAAEEAVVTRMDEDVKHVLKLVHKWLGKLPKRQKEEFKKSKDFQQYKELLEKYGVARPKAPKGEPKEAPKLEVVEGEDYPELSMPKKSK